MIMLLSNSLSLEITSVSSVPQLTAIGDEKTSVSSLDGDGRFIGELVGDVLGEICGDSNILLFFALFKNAFETSSSDSLED